MINLSSTSRTPSTSIADAPVSGVLLKLRKHLHTAPAALAAQSVGRVGDVLQFIQDEARNQQRAKQKAGLGDVGDAPIDDHAGIQQDGATVIGRFPVSIAPDAPRFCKRGRSIVKISFYG
jgi:hypothetical protein